MAATKTSKLFTIPALFLMLGGLLFAPLSHAADLIIADGVVVKFGTDAELVVRDALHTGKQVTLTSLKDDAASGQTGATAQTPAAGDWKGVKLEASAAPANLKLDELALRYAGGQNAAALDIRKNSPILKFLAISNSSTGIRVTQGAAPRFDGLSLIANLTGMQVEGNANPLIVNSQIEGNTVKGVQNNTPAVIVQATGNWWGHASGPRDAVANPNGLGDAVSTGVNAGSWATVIPLINPGITLQGGNFITEQTQVMVNLACRNALEYRLAETTSFTGSIFQPMAASVAFTLSASDGTKQIYAQFRAATGNVTTVSLSRSILLDTQGPAITVTSPAAGAIITDSVTIAASATDPVGVARVEIYIDDILTLTRTAPPFTYTGDASVLPFGTHTIRVVAFDTLGHSSTNTRTVTRAEPPPPDTAGPVLSNLAFAALPLVNGASITQSGRLSLTATDPARVGRVEFAADGQPFATDANGGTAYSGQWDISALSDGNHTLSIIAFDTLGNRTQLDITVVVALAPPAAPVITQPAAGLTTNRQEVVISGSAAVPTSVVLYSNDVQVGAPIPASSAGAFSATVPLTEGANRLRAAAQNRGGLSVLSNEVVVTVDSSIPAAATNLSAIARTGGQIRLSWTASTSANVTGYDVYRASTPFTAIAQAVKANSSRLSTTSFDNLPPSDGTYYYRVIAVNTLGTLSEPSNSSTARADGTLPRAVSIEFQTTGKFDAVGGRFAQGRISVVLTVNESLLTTPFLSIAPQNGVPISISLARANDTEYRGSFDITENTPSGTGFAVFSARDEVGNRGTEILAGSTLRIDTDGPDITRVTLTPVEPIRNDQTTPVTVNALLEFSEAVKTGTVPELAYQLSGVGRSQITIDNLVRSDDLPQATMWQASFTLPPDAGLTEVETLRFIYRGLDDLDNVSTQVLGVNQFQIYQGDLPPLAVPTGLTGKALPSGQIMLSWNAVEAADDYRLFRQAPGEVSLSAYRNTAAQTTFTDSPAQAGSYRYAVASMRARNDQEAYSSPSAAITVDSDATAPAAPRALVLELKGMGIEARWQAPLGASEVLSYQLYRANVDPITSVAGLTPIKRDIRQLTSVDATPSPNEHSYVVTAVDAAGNESPPSNSVYLNFDLLPVTTLAVTQIEEAKPQISWTHSSTQLGFDIYRGPEAQRTRLNTTRLTTLSFTDAEFTGEEERLYIVVAVDTSGAESIGRSIILPRLTAILTPDSQVQRGIMNRVTYQVSNEGSSPVTGATLKVLLNGRSHSSASFTLAAGETRPVPVILGGYAELISPSLLQTTLEIVPNAGEQVRITRSQDIVVSDSALVAGIVSEDLTRGGTGKVRLTLENTSAVDIEIVTAINGTAKASDEIRFKVLDGDGNVLSTQAFRQILGNSIITLANGKTVARIAAGAIFTSDPVDLVVPSAAPDQVTLRLEIDRIHARLGQPDAVTIQGLNTTRTASLVDTAYFGSVDSVSPALSFGDQDIVITGQAIERSRVQPLGEVPVKLVVRASGFERSFDAYTDSAGNYRFTFKPLAGESGIYQVSCVHPSVLDRPNHGQFTINRLTLSPTTITLSIPRNLDQPINLTATAADGVPANNVRLIYAAADQPFGALASGVQVTLGNPLSLISRQSGTLNFRVRADNSAEETGTLILKVISDASGTKALATIRVNYRFSQAVPVLAFAPNFVETGVTQGGSVTEVITLENRGLAEMTDVTVKLVDKDGNAVPNWIYLTTPTTLGTLGIGAKSQVNFTANPGSTVAEGVYEFKLRVTSSNHQTTDINIFVAVTQFGMGNVLFKAADIYTATLDKNGQPIPGLANARIQVQNEQVLSVSQTLSTDSLGEALFNDLPAGRYRFRASAPNHEDASGRFTIKPGITASQDIFLDYNLVSVEFSVTEIALQDRYDITLRATYETDVPAPVIVIEPGSINLPRMAPGDVYNGEFTITNYGLVRADNLKLALPPSDEFIRYEFQQGLPTSLTAKQRITVAYRAISLKAFDPAESGSASGGGCSTYSTCITVNYDYTCANLSVRLGSSRFCVYRRVGQCGGSGGGGGGGGFIGGGGGGGSGGSGSPDYQSISGRQCIPRPDCPDGDCPCGAAPGSGAGDE